MGFGHEKLDVYRAAIEYVGWVYRFCGALSAAKNANRKALLDCLVAMLTKLGQRGYAVNEAQAQYSVGAVTDRLPSDPCIFFPCTSECGTMVSSLPRGRRCGNFYEK